MRYAVLSALFTLTTFTCAHSASADDSFSSCNMMVPFGVALRSDGFIGVDKGTGYSWVKLSDTGALCGDGRTVMLEEMCKSYLSTFGSPAPIDAEEDNTVKTLSERVATQQLQIRNQSNEILRLSRENKRLRDRIRQRR